MQFAQSVARKKKEILDARNNRDALAYVTTHLLLFSLPGVYEIHAIQTQISFRRIRQ